MVCDDPPDRIGLEVPYRTSATDSLIDSPVGLNSLVAPTYIDVIVMKDIP
jgi:hypothetical protein